MSALDSFPIFTLLCISDIFFSRIVSLSASYIAFSSERVNRTVQPLCSNKFCNFNAIFKFNSASVVPLELSAPSSGVPCPASTITTLLETGVDTVSTVFSSTVVLLAILN